MRNALEISKGHQKPAWSMTDVDEMFERAFRNPFSLFEDLQPQFMIGSRWIEPHLDVEETEHAYLLSFDLPGVKKDDLRVDLSENVLTVSGERKHERAARDQGIHRYERAYGQFQRSFTLPPSVDASKVEASLEDGVLRVALPKSEQAKPRSIQIGSGKSSFLSKFIGAKTADEKTQNKTEAH